MMTANTADDPRREMLALLTARVRDVGLREALTLDGALDLSSACARLAAAEQTGALVRDGERLGIFTATDLREALQRSAAPGTLPLVELARFELIEVDAGASLFEALWLMVHHRVHRLLVRDGERVAGLLAQADLVGFLSNHSHVVTLQIDTAQTVDALAAAAARIDAIVALLHDSGLKVERIAHLVGQLNRRLFARLWALVAPGELVANSCLLVMGSEGRGEQILKTDQDNALVLREGFELPGLGEITARFGRALAQLGWPPCPGGIMLTQPRWCASMSTFRATARDWVHGADPEGPMHLAIFFDAAAAAGDAALLEELRAHLDRVVASAGDAFIARFAAAADQFDEPVSWWDHLRARADEVPLDLKKLGTFPIVHGVRALALKHGVRAADTAARVGALVAARAIDERLGRDLVEALHFVMGIRLRHQLAQRDAGEPPSNLVRPSRLSALERRQLKEAMSIVRRFRALLRRQLRLDAL
jgi:CBS domain-containing protein